MNPVNISYLILCAHIRAITNSPNIQIMLCLQAFRNSKYRNPWIKIKVDVPVLLKETKNGKFVFIRVRNAQKMSAKILAARVFLVHF